jgi:hypothetical protein
MTSLTSSQVRLAFRERISAATPATPGHALDVPPNEFVKLPISSPSVALPEL